MENGWHRQMRFPVRPRSPDGRYQHARLLLWPRQWADADRPKRWTNGADISENKMEEAMSLQTLERAILSELKTVSNNPKLKMKDLLEWSTGEVKPHAGEVVLYLPEMGAYCAISTANDKRTT